MTTSYFLNKENISTLWDVISDEEIFKFLSRDIQSNIANLFSNNIKGFFEIEKTKTNNLVDLNKKYILLILNHIKKNFPYQPNKIKIFEEQPVKEFITAEDIQNERKTQFDKDLFQRQQEFEEIITLKVPPVPEFADKNKDTPIGEIDKIIKEMTAKRNYDVENINRIYNSDANQTTNWLKPQETSVKSEKMAATKNNQEEILQPYSRFKFLNNMEEQETNTNISQTKKNVSWEDKELFDDNEILDVNEENIFSKLKKIKSQDTSDNITFSLLETRDENKITNLENEIKSINNKIDIIINILKQNKQIL